MKRKKLYFWEQETFFKKLVCRKSGFAGKPEFIGVGSAVPAGQGGNKGLNQENVDFASDVTGGITTVFGSAAHYSDLVKTAGKIGVVGNVVSGLQYGNALLSKQAKPSHHLDAALTGSLLILTAIPVTAPYAITAGFIYGGARLVGGEAFDQWFNKQFTPSLNINKTNQ